jgi:hypothetical protein
MNLKAAANFLSSLTRIRPESRVGWTQHGYSTIEVPRDCRVICRDGQRTVKGMDWEDSFYRPAQEGNKIVRLLPDRDAYHLTVISCYRTESPQKVLLELLACAAFGLFGTWLMVWMGYNLTGVLQSRGR